MTVRASLGKIATLLCMVIATGLAGSARVQTGFLDRSVEISGRSYRYQVYVPIDFRAKKSWPVILFLHGSGERARMASSKPMSAFPLRFGSSVRDSRLLL